MFTDSMLLLSSSSFGKPSKEAPVVAKSKDEKKKKKENEEKSGMKESKRIDHKAVEGKKKEHGDTKKRSRVISDSDSEAEEDRKVELKKGRKGEGDHDEVEMEAVKDSPVDGDEQDAEDEEDEALEEEEEKEKDGKAIKKLAAIFEKKGPTETKVSWKQGEPVPYSALASTFVDIEATTKRLIILETLTNFFVKVIRLSPDDLLSCVYLCINRLCPDYEGLELGIGESLLIKSIAQSTGRDVARLKKDLEQKGDLGLVAIVSGSMQRRG